MVADPQCVTDARHANRERRCMDSLRQSEAMALSEWLDLKTAQGCGAVNAEELQDAKLLIALAVRHARDVLNRSNI